MSRDPRYDLLFEPVRIGPVVAKNRFYQVPHCNGGGYRDPSAAAEMRRIKAEGGWGVVFTEQVEMHHTSEITPFIELRLWDDNDIPMLARMADAIHEHDALAGIELTYPGVNAPNFYTREVPMAPTALPVRTFSNDPVQAKSMTLRDIKNFRQWHRLAVRRAKSAGFDVICLYGAHGFGVIQHFLSNITNQRTDCYGGSLENRARLFRELVSDTKEEAGDACAVTVRLSLEETGASSQPGFSNQELRDLIGMHADLPDAWDLAQGAWEDCSVTSRFAESGSQQSLISGIRELTKKPVIGVGRFTSPDMMVSQLKSGALDLIGCARPSIADPWLPRKIDEGRVEDIRECIGCNICITGDMTSSPSRCTQNPTFMEEWRRGWHPEHISKKQSDSSVLVIGAGPAGLEATMSLGRRGYEVTLADKRSEVGGRINSESRLPGLSAWRRVRDYREYQISQLANVSTFLESELDAAQVLDFGFNHVVVATGSSWRADGVARHHVTPIPSDNSIPVYTPDDLMNEQLPEGKRVIVYDDDHYYMGSVLSELLVQKGYQVSLVTPSAYAAEWTLNTLEQGFIHKQLLNNGVEIQLNRAVTSVESGCAVHTCTYSGNSIGTEVDALVVVASRQPNRTLWDSLHSQEKDFAGANIKSVTLIGDAEAPAPIAWAVYAGHRFAQSLDSANHDDGELPFKRELAELAQL